MITQLPLIRQSCYRHKQFRSHSKSRQNQNRINRTKVQSTQTFEKHRNNKSVQPLISFDEYVLSKQKIEQYKPETPKLEEYSLPKQDHTRLIEILESHKFPIMKKQNMDQTKYQFKNVSFYDNNLETFQQYTKKLLGQIKLRRNEILTSNQYHGQR